MSVQTNVQAGEKASASAVAAFNREAALARVEGDSELLAEIAAVFLENCDSMLAGLRDAIGNADASGVARAAHTFKGALGSLAAPESCGMAAELEAAASGGELAGAAPAAERLAEAIDRLRPLLQELVQAAAR